MVYKTFIMASLMLANIIVKAENKLIYTDYSYRFKIPHQWDTISVARLKSNSDIEKYKTSDYVITKQKADSLTYPFLVIGRTITPKDITRVPFDTLVKEINRKIIKANYGLLKTDTTLISSKIQRFEVDTQKKMILIQKVKILKKVGSVTSLQKIIFKRDGFISVILQSDIISKGEEKDFEYIISNIEIPEFMKYQYLPDQSVTNSHKSGFTLKRILLCILFSVCVFLIVNYWGKLKPIIIKK